MNAGMQALLAANLKSLRMSTMMKDLDNQLRHAKEGSLSYGEFLLNLTEVEGEVDRKSVV